jgi:hypothetical protein
MIFTAMGYTVKKLAEFAGVSVRTLHYYDETGLLKPDFRSNRGYQTGHCSFLRIYCEVKNYAGEWAYEIHYGKRSR